MTTLPIKAGIDGLPTNTIPTDPAAFIEWFKNSYLPRWAANADIRNATPGTGVQISGNPQTPGFVGFEEIAGNSVLGNPTAAEGDVQAITAGIDGEVLQRVSGSLVFAPIAVTDSITGAGTATSPIELINDSAAPGASQVYGTNVSGVRGWQPLTTSVSPFNITPDTHLASPSGVGIGPNDEFEAGTLIDTAGGRYSGATPWTPYNVGTGTTAISTGVAQGSLVILGGTVAIGSSTIKGYTQPIASPATYLAKVQGAGAGGTFLLDTGIVLSESATGKAVTWGVRVQSAATLNTLFALTWTNPTTFLGVLATESGAPGQFQDGGGTYYYALPVYFQVVITSTTIALNWSRSGVVGTFQTAVSFTKTSVFTVGPDTIGFILNPQAFSGTFSIPPSGIFDFFRRTA